MNALLLKLLGRVYRNEEDGSGSSEGAPAGGSESSNSGQSVDWAALNDGVDPGADDAEDDEAGTPTAPPSEAAEQSPKPAGKGATTPEVEGAAPVEQQQEGESDPAATPPEPEAEPEPTLTAEEIAARDKRFKEDFEQWRASETARLEKEYAFDDETAQRLQTEPELVLPRLAAEMELRITQRALEAFQQMIPQVVPQVVNGQQVEKQADEFFFSKNPDLKKYKAQVLKAGKMFRELNPKATPEEAAEQIGNIVRQSLKLKPVAAAATAPTTPAARQTPHKPAGAGSAPVAKPAAKAGSDVWADLASDDDD